MEQHESILGPLLFSSTALAHNNTCGVPAVFAPAELQNREPTDLSFADNTHFQQQIIDDRNFFRSQHGANPLTWSDQLARSSADWINKCQFVHSVRICLFCPSLNFKNRVNNSFLWLGNPRCRRKSSVRVQQSARCNQRVGVGAHGV